MTKRSKIEIASAGELHTNWMTVCANRPKKVLIPKTRAYLVLRMLNNTEKKKKKKKSKRKQIRTRKPGASTNTQKDHTPHSNLCSGNGDEKVGNEAVERTGRISHVDVVGVGHQETEQRRYNTAHHQHCLTPLRLIQR